MSSDSSPPRMGVAWYCLVLCALFAHEGGQCAALGGEAGLEPLAARTADGFMSLGESEDPGDDAVEDGLTRGVETVLNATNGVDPAAAANMAADLALANKPLFPKDSKQAKKSNLMKQVVAAQRTERIQAEGMPKKHVNSTAKNIGAPKDKDGKLVAAKAPKESMEYFKAAKKGSPKKQKKTQVANDTQAMEELSQQTHPNCEQCHKKCNT